MGEVSLKQAHADLLRLPTWRIDYGPLKRDGCECVWKYYLATISENISNSNTTGYKEADTLFQDLVDQIGATGDYSAGGVSTVVRYNVAEQGSLISTASPTDLAIQSNGFFLVQNSDGATFLTRAGSFVEDSSGNLVNSAGYTLMGYSLAPGSGGVTGTSALALARASHDDVTTAEGWAWSQIKQGNGGQLQRSLRQARSQGRPSAGKMAAATSLPVLW